MTKSLFIGRLDFVSETNKPLPKHFPRIREARELLMSQAEEFIQLKKEIIKKAIEKGDLETADKAINYLLSHMPQFEGVTAVDPDIDKPKQVEGTKGPQISIGIKLGGMDHHKQLSVGTEVIDGEKIE